MDRGLEYIWWPAHQRLHDCFVFGSREKPLLLLLPLWGCLGRCPLKRLQRDYSRVLSDTQRCVRGRLSGAKKVRLCVYLFLPYGAWLGLGTAHAHSSHSPLGVLACFLCAHAHTPTKPAVSPRKTPPARGGAARPGAQKKASRRRQELSTATPGHSCWNHRSPCFPSTPGASAGAMGTPGAAKQTKVDPAFFTLPLVPRRLAGEAAHP